MESKQSLFRAEAMNHRLNRSMGTIRINAPLNYRVVSIFSALILLILILFLSFAETAENIFVRGYLDTEKGIVTVHSLSHGIVLESKAKEGEHVKKGSTLFVISNNEPKHSTEQFTNLTQRRKNLQREHELKNDHFEAITLLYKKHFISASVLKNTEAELLELENKIKMLDLELINYKQKQIIKSPIDGIITNVFYKPGQSVEQSKTLLHIIPHNSQLIARIYIPSQHIGSVKKDENVTIKYDAYPAQRFGTYKASIKEINLTILTDDKEDKPIQIGQPYYKIKANLETPYIKVYGKNSDLSHGLTFTAVITGNKKKIWQWVLDPLYSYYGESFS